MKTLIATLFAASAGAAFAAPTFALNHDPASYRAVTQKAAADYQAASARCARIEGKDKDVCMAEARLARTRTEAAALARYNSTPASRAKARTSLANAEYALAKARCDATGGAGENGCMRDAKAAYTAALEEACALQGDSKIVCLVQDKPDAEADSAGTVANRTEAAAKQTGEALDKAGDKTRLAAADTVITTRVKAGLVKEPDLESLGIHVETEKGVVMLSGFVTSKDEAEKAVRVARGVEGVTGVKSAIRVK